jgi:hypothetical protein
MPGFQRDFRTGRGGYVCNPREWRGEGKETRLGRSSGLVQPREASTVSEAHGDVVRFERLFEQIVDAGRTRALG